MHFAHFWCVAEAGGSIAALGWTVLAIACCNDACFAVWLHLLLHFDVPGFLCLGWFPPNAVAFAKIAISTSLVHTRPGKGGNTTKRTFLDLSMAGEKAALELRAVRSQIYVLLGISSFRVWQD